MNTQSLRFAFFGLWITMLSTQTFAATTTTADVTDGTYVLEKTHASMLWRVSHMGLSNYTARFKRFDATIQWDSKQPAKSSVQATIDVSSIETDLVTPDGRDFNAELKSDSFLSASKFPQATYQSRSVKPTGPRTYRVEGDLTLLGISRPVALDVTLKGALKSHPFAKVPAVGFSAVGQVPRLLFGINPPPIQQGIGTDVQIAIEAEFLLKQ